MKKSQKKLMIFELIIMFILLLNIFLFKISSSYVMPIFLLFLIIIFHKLFYIEKQNKRYVKDIILNISIFLLIFFFLYYLLGIIIGFAKNEYFNLSSIYKYVIPTIMFVYLKEYLRNQLLIKTSEEKRIKILNVLLFILIDLSMVITNNGLSGFNNIFYVVAIYGLPSVATNIFLNYLVSKVGYKPSVYYLLVMKLYSYVLPIIPNPSEYLYAVINLFLPVLLYAYINKFFEKEKDEDVIVRKTKNDIYSALILPTIIAIILVYFTSGTFKYSLIAIASGSMNPNIRKGDAIVIEKVNDKKIKQLKKGTVIAYKYSGVIIVHRIVKIENAGDKKYFYTKGDANSDIDAWVVEENMIQGTIKTNIPYLGRLAIWIRNL